MIPTPQHSKPIGLLRSSPSIRRTSPDRCVCVPSRCEERLVRLEVPGAEFMEWILNSLQPPGPTDDMEQVKRAGRGGERREFVLVDIHFGIDWDLRFFRFGFKE